MSTPEGCSVNEVSLRHSHAHHLHVPHGCFHRGTGEQGWQRPGPMKPEALLSGPLCFPTPPLEKGSLLHILTPEWKLPEEEVSSRAEHMGPGGGAAGQEGSGLRRGHKALAKLRC